MPREETGVIVAEDGTESHESWITLAAFKVQSTGQHLFDSEIRHQHFVRVRVSRCIRRRDLNRDRRHSTTTLMEFAMSHAQWGAFVSSFGDGGGVPATLLYDQDGIVPSEPVSESRLTKSAREVGDAGGKALAEIRESYEALEAAFERGAGKREMRDLIHTLKHRIQNGPANMKFAATSLTEHVENVVTKAKTDIEAMAVAAVDGGLTLDAPSMRLLDSGEDQREEA